MGGAGVLEEDAGTVFSEERAPGRHGDVVGGGQLDPPVGVVFHEGCMLSVQFLEGEREGED